MGTKSLKHSLRGFMVGIMACTWILENICWTQPRKPRGCYHVNADICVDHQWSCGTMHSRTVASRRQCLTQPPAWLSAHNRRSWPQWLQNKISQQPSWMTQFLLESDKMTKKTWYLFVQMDLWWIVTHVTYKTSDVTEQSMSDANKTLSWKEHSERKGLGNLLFIY